jgi:plastocyanin
MRRFGLPLVVVVAVVLLPAPAHAEKTVTMKGSNFMPKEIHAAANEPVKWVNDDSLGHSVAADDGSFDSHPKCGQFGGNCMTKGQSFSHKFPRDGRYSYFCRTHGARGGQGMSGVVIVP